MSISSSQTNRTPSAPRPASAETTAPSTQTAAAAASGTTSATTAATTAAKPASTEAARVDQYVAAQSAGTTSRSMGPSMAKPSRATDMAKLVKPAESFLLRISETRGSQAAAEMRALDKNIDAKAKEGATALGPVGEGVAKAVDETTNRVLARLAEGKVTPDEAKTAMGQLDLATDALKMVKDGNLPNLQRGQVNLLDSGVKTLSFDIKKGNDTYTAQLLSRPEQGYGEPRINIQILKKNGETLPPDQQVSIRTDLARIDGKASVDISSGFLDQKIHGPMMGPDGKPLKGGTIPDHHFHAGIPENLHSAPSYANFVKDFEKKFVDPKMQQLGPVQGIGFQTDNKVSLDAIGKFHGAEAAKKLGGLNDSIDNLAKGAAAAFGQGAEAITTAIDQTTNRILGRVAEGTLPPKDAEKAMEQTRLLASMLNGVKAGQLEGLQKQGLNMSDPTFQGFKFQFKDGADTYGVRVSTRAEAGNGEPRIGFEIAEKNGQKMSPFETVSLRFDLQKFDGRPQIDVASSLLDLNVHGAMDPSKTNGRSGIPDHHFFDAMPQTIANPSGFSQFVNSFRDTHLNANLTKAA